MPVDREDVRVAVAGGESSGWDGASRVDALSVAGSNGRPGAFARDLRSRYVGSALGALWSIAHPLLQLATFTFVFATVMKVRVSAAGDADVPFVLYLACGLFPWLAIQETVTRGATCLVDNPTLVKRVVFPIEVLPVQLACSAALHQLIATAFLLVLMMAFGFPPRASLLALPALLAAQLLIAVGLAWGVAALHVYFRDTAQALGVLLPVWFYLTPIIYPQHLVPSFLRPMLALNPLTPLVQAYRDVFLHGVVPSGPGALWLAVASVGIYAVGGMIFARVRGEFADLV